jgi:hypothetical protein
MGDARRAVASERRGDDFDAMLAEFTRAVEEHNSGIGQ